MYKVTLEMDQESVMEFPCQFPIKVMGKAETDFDALVFSIIKRHVKDINEGAIRMRGSRNGNYVAVTVTIEAHSREQLDNIYMDLTAHDKILMAL